MAKKREFECKDCGHTWEETFGTGRPEGCPACQSADFYRTDAGPKQLRRCKNSPGQRKTAKASENN